MRVVKTTKGDLKPREGISLGTGEGRMMEAIGHYGRSRHERFVRCFFRMELWLTWPEIAVRDLFRLQDLVEMVWRERTIVPTKEQVARSGATFPVSVSPRLDEVFGRVPSLGLRLVGVRHFKTLRPTRYVVTDDHGVFFPFAVGIALQAVMRTGRTNSLEEIVVYRLIDRTSGEVLSPEPASFVVTWGRVDHQCPREVWEAMMHGRLPSRAAPR